jgi:hypothetical protein
MREHVHRLLSRVLPGVTVKPLASVACAAALWLCLLLVPVFVHDLTVWVLYGVVAVVSVLGVFVAPKVQPLQSSTELHCCGSRTRFDIINPLDWIALLSVLLDPMFIASAGVSSYGFNVSVTPPVPTTAFEFSDDTSGTLLLQKSDEDRQAGFVIAMFVVTLYAVLKLLGALLPEAAAAPHRNACLAALGGGAFVPVLTELARRSLADPVVLCALAFYAPWVLALEAREPWGSNVRYSARFVVLERLFKGAAALSCVALSATGHDVAQVGAALACNVVTAGALVYPSSCSLRGLARTRIYMHGVSILALAVNVAVRYGSEYARTVGWASWGGLTGVFLLHCMCKTCCCKYAPEAPAEKSSRV